jgi:hypothetical protein
MMQRARRALWLFAVLSAAFSPAAALQREGDEQIALRVTSARPGSAIVDHGSADGLAVDDRVRFFPRGERVVEGTVTELEQRAATVELRDPVLLLAPGTRGEAWIPAERLAALAEPEDVEPLAPPATDVPPHPPWENQDEEWRAGEPLLARIEARRPEDRPARISGRFIAIADQIWSTEDDRTSGFYRAGMDVSYENLTGRADSLHFDGEANYRHTDVPDLDDQEESRLRLDRLSYTRGGHRFAPQRWEFGRFLQQGMSEFGVLDGAEWTLRGSEGDRFGFSAGFMPEPDLDHDTGEDFQLSGHYRWVFDESEQLAASGGYQKTFHEGNADRDLVVGKLQVAPRGPWSFHGTAWVDFYTDGDDEKPFLELTQTVLDAGRAWESGSSLHLSLTHLAFPQIDRDEFLPVTDEELAEAHSERLGLDGRVQATRDTGISGGVGAWVDEDDQGGDAELGFDLRDFWLENGFLEVDSFATKGSFTTTLGGRLSLGAIGERGRWSVDYELAAHRFEGFSDDNDDLPQHRLRAAGELSTDSGWSFSGYVEGQLWDDENSLALGFYLQRSF